MRQAQQQELEGGRCAVLLGAPACSQPASRAFSPPSPRWCDSWDQLATASSESPELGVITRLPPAAQLIFQLGARCQPLSCILSLGGILSLPSCIAQTLSPAQTRLPILFPSPLA